ncbi:LLM class flavin-dependent oxidoreductase [Microlunatus flavus]|uniref:Luciferase-like monooxygenase n=1 Tax=Microlunatus flavus TaxID=1036181 RepID=A0A1H9NEY4_9ACTN|nr:LLM class flavin-dependent oxidoreductase [Microlunatus flavus]SER34544.1 Luciferase-like monooxygenase [Microlunatus flavus]
MTPVPALGLCFTPDMAPGSLVRLAQSIEAAGLDELWVWEDCFKESGVASAAVALASTVRIRVGIGLMPTPLRNVALTAMEVATLAGAFPGRLMPGIGHGVQEWMGQVGARARSPLGLLEEYATALRALLAGETVTTDGAYVHLDGVRLDWPPEVVPPLFIGGTGPKSVRLAAGLGDGYLAPCAWSDAQVADVSEQVTAVRGPGHPFVYSEIAATGPGARERVDAELPRYGGEAGRQIGTAGDEDVFVDAVRRLAGLGVDHLVIQPTKDEPDLDGLVAFVGRVRTRLHEG